MSDLPYTRQPVKASRQQAIREAVRGVTRLPSTAAQSRLARPKDSAALLELFQHPDVHQWIYSLPRPLTLDSVRSFIQEQRQAQAAGQGFLSLNFDEDGRVSGYTEILVWPEWAAGEVGGAIRPDLQNRGQGATGMIATFSWMFETLDLDLICNTTAPDNIRMQTIFRKTGFSHMADTQSRRPDGTMRASQIWEVTRDDWFRQHGAQA